MIVSFSPVPTALIPHVCFRAWSLYKNKKLTNFNPPVLCLILFRSSAVSLNFSCSHTSAKFADKRLINAKSFMTLAKNLTVQSARSPRKLSTFFLFIKTKSSINRKKYSKAGLSFFWHKLKGYRTSEFVSQESNWAFVGWEMGPHFGPDSQESRSNRLWLIY